MLIRVAPWTTGSILLIMLTFGACAGGDSGAVQFGTPEWYWQAANETFAAADFGKTEEHLKELVETENPWRERAAVWRVVVLNGLSRGYMDLANAYETGAEEHEGLAPQFQNSIQQYRRDARQYAIDFTEFIGPLQKLVDGLEKVQFDFSFPSGSPNPSPILASLSGGQVPPESQLFEAQTETVKRGLVLQATEMVGAGDEVNKARTLFENLPVEVGTTAFLLEVGRSLHDRSELFVRELLNEPEIRKIMLQRASDCIGPALEAEDEQLKKQAEELKEKIEEALNPPKRRRR